MLWQTLKDQYVSKYTPTRNRLSTGAFLRFGTVPFRTRDRAFSLAFGTKLH
jgi:hypothetical protein